MPQKKVLFLAWPGHIRGGGAWGLQLRKKIPMATKPRGGGGEGLSGRATKKITFFAASLIEQNNLV